MKKIIVLIMMTLACTGCVWKWQLRNPSEVPPQLKVLYLNDPNVDSHFNLRLINLLQSMKINLVNSPDQAPLTLNAFRYRLQHNNPPVSSTNIAITYTYILTVTVSITDRSGKIVVPPHQISTSRSVTVNTNQIFTINSTSVFQEELQREATNLIYYWLTSGRTGLKLNPNLKKGVNIHAAPAPTTVPAS